MTKNKLLIIIGIFILSLLGIRLLWLGLNTTPEHPKAIQGILDLRHWEFDNKRSIPLDGEWEYYPNQFIQSNSESLKQSNINYLQVPGNWSQFVTTEGSTYYGYGSYRLRILLSEPIKQPLKILVNEIGTSFELFVNGVPTSKLGQPAEALNNYTPKKVPYPVTLEKSGVNEIELIFHIANYSDPLEGGIIKSIRFGTEAQINKERMVSLSFQFMTFVILALHGVYAGILYLFNRRQKLFLYLFLLMISAACSIVIDDDKMLLMWIPLNYTWSIKIIYLSYIGTAVFTLKISLNLFPEVRKNLVFHWFFILSGVYALFICLSPVQYVNATSIVFMGILLFASISTLFMLIQMINRKYDDVIYLLLSAASIFSSIIWGIFKNLTWASPSFYPFDIIIAVLCFSTYWFRQYSRNLEQKIRFAEQLQRSNKLKDEFLANTSRELRTPLHGIINIAQSLQDNERSTLSEKSNKDLELLVTVGHRMSLMLNELLELAQLKENRLQLNLSSIHLQSIASSTVNILKFMTDGKQIQVVTQIPDDFPAIVGDEQRLIQILFNLLHNAIKYTSHGSITINAEVKNGRAYIHIIDTGIGIDKETQSRVFEPYEQGDYHITSVGGGIGLGLSISKQLVELHGGTLSLDSTIGKGSTFTISLPIVQHSDKQEQLFDDQFRSAEHLTVAVSEEVAASNFSPTIKPTFAAEKLAILAVDDDPINLKVIENILSSDQYEIIAVTSGSEAIARLEERQWDLVIADVMMPQMSGYELTKTIRERFSISELPILLLTARTHPEDIFLGFSSGANDYVSKPANALELKYRVRALTDLKQSISTRLRIEAAYLQAQIQPHFLFNTLNSITALSDIDTNKMNDLIEAFSTYLRISFNFWNAKKLVFLKHELELVRSYLYIEQERFGDRLKVIWDIQVVNYHIQIPPLSIQPLIENAVRHGILSRAKGGTIYLRIIDNSDHTRIIIEDNGVGMNEEKIRNLTDNNLNSKAGIGIRNTDRRLKQLFGHGLIIHSKPNQGTTISFTIPKHNEFHIQNMFSP